jgi:signal transduction histidine kinase
MMQPVLAHGESYLGNDIRELSSTDTLHDVLVSDIEALQAASDYADMLALYEDRLDSMGLIIRGIAHDINNLLTVIDGFGTIIKMAAAANKDVSTAVNGLDDASGQLASLARILSSLASRRAMSTEPIAVNALLASMERTIRHLLGEGVVVHIRRHPTGGAVRTVRGQLERVLLNLVMNAREAMGSRGRLLIQARTVHITDDDLRARARLLPGEYISLAVSDTGCGMSQQTMERIFEPAFSTKSRSRGHGLATVKRIVAECGGEVFVESETGRGTTFEILLPCA